MDNSSKFFANKACKYYPCHQGVEEINCLFCFCPMYFLDRCPGNPEYIERDGKRIKKCTACVWPHLPENYDKMMKLLKIAVRKDSVGPNSAPRSDSPSSPTDDVDK